MAGKRMVIQTAEGKLVDNVYEDPVDQWQNNFRRWVDCDSATSCSSCLPFTSFGISRRTGPSSIPTCSSISNMAPSAASRAVPSSRRSAEFFLPIGCSKRFPRFVPTSCRADTPRSGWSSNRATIFPSAFPAGGRLGLEQVGLNCAVCHTGTVRESSNCSASNRAGHAGASTGSRALFRVRTIVQFG